MASTICGWCGDRTHMTMVTEPYRLPEATWRRRHDGAPDADWPVFMAAFRCSNENCDRLSVGWSELLRHTGQHAKITLPQAELSWEPVQARRPSFPDIPDEIASTASEAHACLSVGAARGAVALARAVVESTAKAKGIDEGNLVRKIDKMHEAGLISKLTADTSHAIRHDGNNIAHGDLGEEPVSQDDADAILEFMDALLDEVFQRPAKLQRLQQRSKDRKAGASDQNAVVRT